MYCSRLFVVVFQDINCLHTFKHAHVRRSQSFISLPSFMFVSAVVSEICESKEKKEKKKEKKKLKLTISNLTPFLGI